MRAANVGNDAGRRRLIIGQFSSSAPNCRSVSARALIYSIIRGIGVSRGESDEVEIIVERIWAPLRLRSARGRAGL